MDPVRHCVYPLELGREDATQVGSDRPERIGHDAVGLSHDLLGDAAPTASHGLTWSEALTAFMPSSARGVLELGAPVGLCQPAGMRSWMRRRGRTRGMR